MLLKKKFVSGFTMIEILVVVAIIGILSTIGLVSFNASLEKGRDARRRSDLKQIAIALENYYNDFGQYPLRSGGSYPNILACDDGTQACTWGARWAVSETVYMPTLPEGPRGDNYHYYVCHENGRSWYQLYTRLENDADPNILESIVDNNLDCGGGLACNYGISSTNASPEEPGNSFPGDDCE